MPFLNKDVIKENLFETVGWKNSIAWSKKLSVASNKILLDFAERLASTGFNFIMESNFGQEFNLQLKKLGVKYGHSLIQVNFNCEFDILKKRFENRWKKGKRHPGHIDNKHFNKFDEVFDKYSKPLDVGGPVIKVDTTDFRKVNYSEVFNKINKL